MCAGSYPPDSKWRRLQEEYWRGTLAPVEDRPPTAEMRIRAILASHADEAPCNAVRAEVWDVATAGGQGRAAAMLTMDLDRDGGAKIAGPAPALQQQEGAGGTPALPQPPTLLRHCQGMNELSLPRRCGRRRACRGHGYVVDEFT